MPLSLKFHASHRYVSTDGINVPVELGVSNRKVELFARPDTGAAHCIFERRYAEELGLDVEAGRPQRFRTMAGAFMTYEHEVSLHTLGTEFLAGVFFAHDQTFNKSFVGRSGWLDRLRAGTVDYDRLLYLSAYDL